MSVIDILSLVRQNNLADDCYGQQVTLCYTGKPEHFSKLLKIVYCSHIKLLKNKQTKTKKCIGMYYNPSTFVEIS